MCVDPLLQEPIELSTAFLVQNEKVKVSACSLGDVNGLTEIAGLDIDGRVKNGVGHCRTGQ